VPLASESFNSGVTDSASVSDSPCELARLDMDSMAKESRRDTVPLFGWRDLTLQVCQEPDGTTLQDVEQDKGVQKVLLRVDFPFAQLDI
jgi:hypothetical protein